MGSLGDHHIQRSNVAKKATKAYKEAIDNYLRGVLKSGAYSIVLSAFRLRLNNRGAHNFTGNLINSICAGVYYKGNLDEAYYSFDLPGMQTPIMGEMTASPDGKSKTYRFTSDWEGEESKYTPSIITDKSRGQIHAVDFINEYTPTSPYLEVVLAYTVEYSEYVEKMGHLGYDAAYKDFNRMFVAIQEKVSKGANFGKSGVLRYVNVTMK